MTRLTVLLLAVALVLPGAALAAPTRDNDAALATERYYSSYGDAEPLSAVPAPAPAASADARPTWLGAIMLGLGLALVAGGLGVYAGRVVRPRGAGA